MEEKSSISRTVDHNEIQHFKKLSKEWWNPESKLQNLFLMNKVRVPFIKEALIRTGAVSKEMARTSKPLEGLEILDAGCGGGFLSEALADLGAKVIGIDATEEIIQIAKAHKELNPSLNDNLVYIHDTIESFAEMNRKKFDVVVSSEVIEHINEKEDFVKNCVDTLKPKGSIIFTTIAKTFKSRIFIFASEHIFNLVPRGTHEFRKMISSDELQRILSHCNCTTEKVNGMGFKPFSHTWCWISNVDIFYALHAVRNKDK